MLVETPRGAAGGTNRTGEFASLAQIRAWAKLSPQLPLFCTVLVFTPDEAGEAHRATGKVQDVAKSEGVTLAAYLGRHLRLLLDYPPDEYPAVQMRRVLEHVRALSWRWRGRPLIKP